MKKVIVFALLFIVSFFGLIPSSQINWAGLFIIGLILGAAASSLQIKEFKLKTPNKLDVVKFFGGAMILIAQIIGLKQANSSINTKQGGSD